MDVEVLGCRSCIANVYWQAGNTMAQAAAPKRPGEAYRHVRDGSVYNRRFWFAIDYWAFVSRRYV